MTHSAQVSELALTFFKNLSKSEVLSAILHHFDLEAGGDIDFCVGLNEHHAALTLINDVAIKSGLQITQVFRHERAAAYIVCRDLEGQGGHVILDYCSDYQIRGHAILEANEILGEVRGLKWGGKGVAKKVELKYRFVKAAAKGKDPASVVQSLSELWDDCGDDLSLFLKGKWGIDFVDWSLESVTSTLEEVRGRLKKRRWTFGEFILKFIRVIKPRGLWIRADHIEIDDVKENFRSVSQEENLSWSSFKGVLASKAVVSGTKSKVGLFGSLLTWMDCRVDSSDRHEIEDFLAKRNRRYEGLS